MCSFYKYGLSDPRAGCPLFRYVLQISCPANLYRFCCVLTFRRFSYETHFTRFDVPGPVFSLIVVPAYADESYDFVYDSESGYYLTDSAVVPGFYSVLFDLNFPEEGLVGSFSSLPNPLTDIGVAYVAAFTSVELGLSVVFSYDPSVGALLGFYQDGDFVSVSDLLPSFSLIPSPECYVFPAFKTDLYVPAGSYNFDIYWPQDDGYFVWQSSYSVDLAYSSIGNFHGFLFPSDFVVPGSDETVSLGLYHDAGGSRMVYIPDDANFVDSFPPFPGIVVFYPASDSPSSPVPCLPGIVDSGMMSGVLEQVVDLLPIVVGLIVGFIGLRKAISWLQGILLSA